MSGALVVLYGLGAASPNDIYRVAGERPACIFLYDSTDAHSSAMAPVLHALGEAMDVAGCDDTQIASHLATASVCGVLTFSESMVRRAARLALMLGCVGNSPEAVEALTDKARQREVLASAGVSPTRAVRVDRGHTATVCDLVGLPAVLKPCVGSASRGVTLVRTEHELSEALRNVTTPMIVEEFLVGSPHPDGDWLGDYVSVESVAKDGSYWHFCVTDKLPLAPSFRETGFVLPSAIDDDRREESIALTTRALAALGVTWGITHTELKLTPRGMRIIEVNGRLGGSIQRLVTRASDLNPVKLALDAASGDRSACATPSFSAHVANLFLVPPPQAQRVVGLADVKKLRSITGVWAVDEHARPGQLLDQRAGSLSRVQTICVEAPSRDALRDRIEAVRTAAYDAADFV